MTELKQKTTSDLRKLGVEYELKLSKLELELASAKDQLHAVEKALDKRTDYLDKVQSTEELDKKLAEAQKTRLRRSLVEIEVSRYCNNDALKEVLCMHARAPFTFSIPCLYCGVMIRHIKFAKDRKHLACEDCGGCEIDEHRC